MTIFFISIPNRAINPEKDYRTINQSDTMEFLNPILEKLNYPIDKFKFYGAMGYDDQFVQVLFESKNEIRLLAEKLDAEIDKIFKEKSLILYESYKEAYSELVQITFSKSIEDFEEDDMDVLNWK